MKAVFLTVKHQSKMIKLLTYLMFGASDPKMKLFIYHCFMYFYIYVR